jgi:hypothetical protein
MGPVPDLLLLSNSTAPGCSFLELNDRPVLAMPEGPGCGCQHAELPSGSDITGLLV